MSFSFTILQDIQDSTLIRNRKGSLGKSMGRPAQLAV